MRVILLRALANLWTSGQSCSRVTHVTHFQADDAAPGVATDPQSMARRHASETNFKTDATPQYTGWGRFLPPQRRYVDEPCLTASAARAARDETPSLPKIRVM